jgi:hypothetical protein
VAASGEPVASLTSPAVLLGSFYFLITLVGRIALVPTVDDAHIIVTVASPFITGLAGATAVVIMIVFCGCFIGKAKNTWHLVDL